MRKLILAAIVLMMIAVIGMGAENATCDEGYAYWTGVEDGYRLGILFMQGQTNETIANQYNEQAEMINGILDSLGYNEDTRLGEFKKIIENYELPPIFR